MKMPMLNTSTQDSPPSRSQNVTILPCTCLLERTQKGGDQVCPQAKAKKTVGIAAVTSSSIKNGVLGWERKERKERSSHLYSVS